LYTIILNIHTNDAYTYDTYDTYTSQGGPLFAAHETARHMEYNAVFDDMSNTKHTASSPQSASASIYASSASSASASASATASASAVPHDQLYIANVVAGM
jgi:hypothetical protein